MKRRAYAYTPETAARMLVDEGRLRRWLADDGLGSSLAAQVRPHVLEGVVLYACGRVRPGRAMEAVLKGDLQTVLAAADDALWGELRALVAILTWALPEAIWGDDDAVEAWLAQGMVRRAG